MRYLYTFGFYCALPFVVLRAIWRTRKQSGHLHRIGERLGFYSTNPETTSIWIHAVSYGEAIAAEPLILRLRKSFPLARLIVTTMTLTGANRVENAWKNDSQIKHFYLPYDLPFAIKRFLNHIKPQLGIIMETEMWPNLLYLSGKYNIPLILANARLSLNSFKGYQRITRFLAPLLKTISLVAAQSKDDAERFITLGVDPARVSIVGNVKFDITPPENQIRDGQEAKQALPFEYIVVAASTHANEEEQLLDAFAQIQQNYPQSLLILVPRHPERFDEVAKICIKKGYALSRRSSNGLPDTNTPIYLGDTMGELYFFYAMADVAFVGGSLVPIGGHNLLEPAALKLPIITGPYLSNFKFIQQLLSATKTLHIAENQIELIKLLEYLLSQPFYRQEVGLLGFQAINEHQGATERLFKIISSYLPHLSQENHLLSL